MPIGGRRGMLLFFCEFFFYKISPDGTQQVSSGTVKRGRQGIKLCWQHRSQCERETKRHLPVKRRHMNEGSKWTKPLLRTRNPWFLQLGWVCQLDLQFGCFYTHLCFRLHTHTFVLLSLLRPFNDCLSFPGISTA